MPPLKLTIFLCLHEPAPARNSDNYLRYFKSTWVTLRLDRLSQGRGNLSDLKVKARETIMVDSDKPSAFGHVVTVREPGRIPRSELFM